MTSRVIDFAKKKVVNSRMKDRMVEPDKGRAGYSFWHRIPDMFYLIKSCTKMRQERTKCSFFTDPFGTMFPHWISTLWVWFVISFRELWLSKTWTLNQEQSRKIRWYGDTFHESVNSKSLHKREDSIWNERFFQIRIGFMYLKLLASCGSIQAPVQLWISTSSSFSSKNTAVNGYW